MHDYFLGSVQSVRPGWWDDWNEQSSRSCFPRLHLHLWCRLLDWIHPFTSTVPRRGPLLRDARQGNGFLWFCGRSCWYAQPIRMASIHAENRVAHVHHLHNLVRYTIHRHLLLDPRDQEPHSKLLPPSEPYQF